MSTDGIDKSRGDKIALGIRDLLLSNPELLNILLNNKEKYGRINKDITKGNVIFPFEFRKGYFIKKAIKEMGGDVNDWMKKLNMAIMYLDDKNITYNN